MKKANCILAIIEKGIENYLASIVMPLFNAIM